MQATNYIRDCKRSAKLACLNVTREVDARANDDVVAAKVKDHVEKVLRDHDAEFAQMFEKVK